MDGFNSLTTESFRALLNYDPETGKFTWKKTFWRAIEGRQAGSLSTGGYRQIKFDGRLVAAHRLAFLYMTGEWPKRHVDHINGMRDDNRWSNLRDIPRVINMQNQRRAHAGYGNRLLGTHFNKQSGRWIANITVNKKRKYLGLFATEEEAHSAYLEAKRELHTGCTI